MRTMYTALVSACLLGIRCRYDADRKTSERIMKLLKDGIMLLPVCPEQLSGLPTPRPRNRIIDGDGSDVLDGIARVVDENGNDNTELFIKGAEETLRIAELFGVKKAYLKAGSPSCGCGEKGVTTEADGVATALLKRNGIKVVRVESCS